MRTSKSNQDIAVITGSYQSPVIVVLVLILIIVVIRINST
jgi:hypothetical protein